MALLKPMGDITKTTPVFYTVYGSSQKLDYFKKYKGLWLQVPLKGSKIQEVFTCLSVRSRTAFVTAIASKLQEEFTKHYRWVVEIKMKTVLKDGYGPRKGAGIGGYTVG